MSDQANLSDDVIASTYAKSSLDDLTSGIVAAYVSNNTVRIEDLPGLITSVRATLSAPLVEPAPVDAGPEKATPAQVKKSITHDALISFEDGKPYKTLRRHLTLRSLTPDAYRAKWGLPADYPMTSPGYSAQRSELAKALGLGQARRASAKAASSDETVAAEVPPAPPKRKKIGIA